VFLAVTYRQARARVSDLARALSPDQLQMSVPATPAWTIHQVLAHLAGGAADAANDRLDGAPGARWSQRHVDERRHQPVGELLAEWEQVAPQIESTLTEEMMLRPNIVADTLCHESDLREALGLAPMAREHWQPFLDVMMQYLTYTLRGATTVIIRDEHGEQWTCGDGEPTTLLRADGYELLRASYSRRSQRQIAAWNWTPAPSQALIRRIGFFGPCLDDQPVPSL
jgi:uncharacterized protein (TIGR03083 family)